MNKEGHVTTLDNEHTSHSLFISRKDRDYSYAHMHIITKANVCLSIRVELYGVTNTHIEVIKIKRETSGPIHSRPSTQVKEGPPIRDPSLLRDPH